MRKRRMVKYLKLHIIQKTTTFRKNTHPYGKRNVFYVPWCMYICVTHRHVLKYIISIYLDIHI